MKTISEYFEEQGIKDCAGGLRMKTPIHKAKISRICSKSNIWRYYNYNQIDQNIPNMVGEQK